MGLGDTEARLIRQIAQHFLRVILSMVGIYWPSGSAQ
jgi:hypothetical protein